MEKYNVNGMSCAACSSRVEKAVLNVDGVTSCSVNLLTNSMIVDGTADESAIIIAVQKAGYSASKNSNKLITSADNNSLKDKETPILCKRLIYSPSLSVAADLLMYSFFITRTS